MLFKCYGHKLSYKNICTLSLYLLDDVYQLYSLNAEHTLEFGSAYADNKFTNFTPFFVGTLDYMFFSRNKLRVAKVSDRNIERIYTHCFSKYLKITVSFDCSQIVPMPDENTLAEDKGLPSKYLGSDHLALVSDFEWLDKTTET